MIGGAGYGGFIPESALNKSATEQADLQGSRPDAYSPGQLLFGLDQWSRRRHPDYTGLSKSLLAMLVSAELEFDPALRSFLKKMVLACLTCMSLSVLDACHNKLTKLSGQQAC